MVNPAAESKIRATPIHFAVPLVAVSDKFTGLGLIITYDLMLFEKACGAFKMQNIIICVAERDDRKA
jgi:hypothetical protein